MDDPSTALQKVFYSRLTALGMKVYDRIPDAATFPYVSIGQAQVLGERRLGRLHSTIHSTVHVWSRSVGRGEANSIAGKVISALDAELPVPGYLNYVGRFADTTDVGEKDGLTTHLALTFEHRLEPMD